MHYCAGGTNHSFHENVASFPRVPEIYPKLHRPFLKSSPKFFNYSFPLFGNRNTRSTRRIKDLNYEITTLNDQNPKEEAAKESSFKIRLKKRSPTESDLVLPNAETAQNDQNQKEKVGEPQSLKIRLPKRPSTKSHTTQPKAKMTTTQRKKKKCKFKNSAESKDLKCKHCGETFESVNLRREHEKVTHMTR